MVLNWNVVFGYIDAHNWAALGWTGVGILLLAWKHWKLALWDRLPQIVKFLIPVVVATLTDAVQGVLRDGESTMVALWTGLLFALSLQGVFAGLKASPGVTKLLSAKRSGLPKSEAMEIDDGISTGLHGEVAHVDPKDGVVALKVEPEVAKLLGNTTVGKRAKLSIVALALLLGGCAGWQGKAQDALAGAQAVCQNQLLRSPERERLIAQGFAPAEVIAIFNQVCTGIETYGPGVDAILEAAKQQRSLPSRALASEGRSLGLLP